jgi:hypothetical protein
MSGFTLTRGYFTYSSDDGNLYQVFTTVENGSINGSSPNIPNSHPTYHRAWKPRQVWGINPTTKTEISVPVLSASNTLWNQSTTTFSKAGVTWTITRRAGEIRKNQ